MKKKKEKKLLEINIRNKKLWFGFCEHPFCWFDIGNYFSIDIGKWFLRIFLGINGFNFCRYLGIIRC